MVGGILVPGLLFLTVDQVFPLYGKVLHRPVEGYCLTLCYQVNTPFGQHHKLPINALGTPISLRQFEEARRLYWPSDIEDLAYILNLPPD